jgi:hypothetical protein
MNSKKNPRLHLFQQLFPHEHKSAYPGWLRRHSNDFRKSRHIYSDVIPPDMQDEFTDWLRLQHMEMYKHG